jgi:hypothetical protein
MEGIEMVTKSRIGLIALVAVVLGGCPSPDDPPRADPPVDPAADRRMAAPDEMPDTTGESLWSYLRQADYRRWRLWPATMPQYEGTQPHGALLTTYLNDRAYGALTATDGPLPSGSIIVKESYDADSTMVDITVMYVVEGYNPAHNDWFWARYGRRRTRRKRRRGHRTAEGEGDFATISRPPYSYGPVHLHRTARWSNLRARPSREGVTS